MSEQHYALSELSQAKRGILQACEDLPVSRAKIDETMKSKKKNAKDWHSFLTAEHKKLLEAIESCRFCLLEMGMEDLADKAHKLYQSVKKFNLATPDYSKLMALLLSSRSGGWPDRGEGAVSDSPQKSKTRPSARRRRAQRN